MKKVFWTLAIGGLGGVLLVNIILPALVEADFLGSANFLKILVKPQIQTVIKETERVVTIEPDFWKDVLSRAEKSVVFVQYFSSSGILLSQSNGIILTNDGLITVPLNAIPANVSSIQVFGDDKVLKGALATVDSVNNLGLIKVEASNLPILDFADLDNLALGQNVLVVAKKIRINEINTFAHSSMISELTDQVYFLDLVRGQQRGQISGSLAIDSKGKIIGMIQISNQGQVFIMPNSFFERLLEKYLIQ